MFSSESSRRPPVELLPADTCFWALISKLEIVPGKIKEDGKRTGESVKWELKITEGKYAGKKFNVWTVSPFDEHCSEKGYILGVHQFVRILEMVGAFVHGKDETYKSINKQTNLADVVDRINGSIIGIKVGIQQPAKDSNFSANNTVKEWLSPNPTCEGVEGLRLLQKEYGNCRSMEIVTKQLREQKPIVHTQKSAFQDVPVHAGAPVSDVTPDWIGGPEVSADVEPF